MTVQKYKVWPEGSEDEAEEIFAGSPEAAGEYYAEDNHDGRTGTIELNVEAEDGTLYGVFVEIVATRRATGRLS